MPSCAARAGGACVSEAVDLHHHGDRTRPGSRRPRRQRPAARPAAVARRRHRGSLARPRPLPRPARGGPGHRATARRDPGVRAADRGRRRGVHARRPRGRRRPTRRRAPAVHRARGGPRRRRTTGRRRHVLRAPTTASASTPRLRPSGEHAAADLVVVGNPTNPTGVLHPAGDLRALRRPGRVLVVDEAFMDAVPGEPESLIGSDLEGLLVLRSLTKTWGLAGLRAGYVVGDPALVAALRAVQPPWSVSTPGARCHGRLPVRARRRRGRGCGASRSPATVRSLVRELAAVGLSTGGPVARRPSCSSTRARSAPASVREALAVRASPCDAARPSPDSARRGSASPCATPRPPVPSPRRSTT